MFHLRSWLSNIPRSRTRKRCLPLVRRPQEASRFLPLLESMERRESAALLSVSGIGLAAAEITLLNRPEDDAGLAQGRPHFADDNLDQLQSTSLLAGTAGFAVTPSDAAGNPSPDIIDGDNAPAPGSQANGADGFVTLGASPIPDLASNGVGGGSAFGNSASSGASSSVGGSGGGSGGASPVGFAGGSGGGTAPAPAKFDSAASQFMFTPTPALTSATNGGSPVVIHSATADSPEPPPTDPTTPVGHGHGKPHGEDPLFVVDVNKQVVLTPGVPQNDFSTWSVSLIAQVSGGTVSTYSWNTSGASDATSVSGASTYNLTFTWASFIGGPRTDTITITTTNTDSSQQSQALTFKVWGTNTNGYSASPPTMPSTWPAAITPDAVQSQQATVSGAYYQLGLDTGELQVSHTLATYNPAGGGGDKCG